MKTTQKFIADLSKYLALLTVSACAGLSTNVVWAAFPEKPITLIVPYPAGGATDTIARKLQEPLSKILGQVVLVENKPGAGTAIGAAFAAKSPADGYTLLISSNTTFTVNPALKDNLQYDALKSFEGVGVVGTSPLVLIANPKLAANNIQELVSLAKNEPGKLSIGSFGNGTTSHLAAEMFKVMAGVDIVHVPYKGSAPAMTDLIGGQIPLTFDTNVAAMPVIASGKVKALGIASKTRSPQMPDVPAIAESGYPDFEMVPWVVIVAPRGLPAEVQGKLGAALENAVKDPAVRAELIKVGLDVGFEPGSSYDIRVAKELPLLKTYVKQANIPAE